jgi:hypothetical protein
MNKITYLFTIVAATTLFSCNNESENLLEPKKSVYVANLSDFISPESRASGKTEEQVLCFENKESFDKTIAQLQSMDEPAKKIFFQNLGFNGAYTLLSTADAELDSIFDMNESDSIAINNNINAYLKKYENVLEFNQEDTTDVTPNLTFEGEELQLVGSVSGYVVISGQLIEADKFVVKTDSAFVSAPSLTISRSDTPYNGSFIEYKNVSVKNGSYTSYLRFGRKGLYLAFKTETYRKILFWKKYDKSCGHDGKIEISDSKNQNKYIYTIKHKSGEWSFKESPASLYSPRVNAKITNFSSTRNSNNKVSKTYTNILVK